MRDRIARMRADRHLQCPLRLGILSLGGVKHREIVVGFRQFRVIVGQCSEDADGLLRLVLFGEDQTFEKPRPRVFRVACEHRVDFRHRRTEPALLEQLGGILIVVCMGRSERDQERQGENQRCAKT